MTEMTEMTTLNDVLRVELQKMRARRLDFAPAPEDLPATRAVMLEDLRRYGLTDEDADRLQEAFNKLGPRIERWPQPWTVIQALPSDPKPGTITFVPCGHVNRPGLRKFIDVAREKLGLPAPQEND